MIQGHVHEAYALLSDQLDSEEMQWDFTCRLLNLFINFFNNVLPALITR